MCQFMRQYTKVDSGSQKGVHVQERAVQPFVPEYRTVLQLMAGEDEEAGHRAVKQQREREQGPQPLREQPPGQHPGDGGERQVPDRLNRPARVVAPHQPAQHRRLDWTAVPPHPHSAPHLVERRVCAGHRGPPPAPAGSIRTHSFVNTGTGSLILALRGGEPLTRAPVATYASILLWRCNGPPGVEEHNHAHKWCSELYLQASTAFCP